MTIKDSKIDERVDETKIPKTKKGLLMKEKIIEAARTTFSKNGYFAVRILDITKEAGISEGNFYRYFNNKEEVLKIIIEMLLTDLYHASRSSDINGTFHEKLVHSTKRLFRVYLDNAGIYKVLLQIVHYDENFNKMWQEMRSLFVKRIRKELEKVSLDPGIDKDYVASALGSMVSQFAYIWCVLGGEDTEKEFDIDVAAQSVSSVWFTYIQSYQK
jgi:AcrR family transcriptional regulator